MQRTSCSTRSNSINKHLRNSHFITTHKSYNGNWRNSLTPLGRGYQGNSTDRSMRRWSLKLLYCMGGWEVFFEHDLFNSEPRFGARSCLPYYHSLASFPPPDNFQIFTPGIYVLLIYKTVFPLSQRFNHFCIIGCTFSIKNYYLHDIVHVCVQFVHSWLYT